MVDKEQHRTVFAEESQLEELSFTSVSLMYVNGLTISLPSDNTLK